MRLLMNIATPDTYPDLFWGYTVLWLLIALLMLRLVKQQSKLHREIDELSRESEQKRKTVNG